MLPHSLSMKRSAPRGLHLVSWGMETEKRVETTPVWAARR